MKEMRGDAGERRREGEEFVLSDSGCFRKMKDWL